MDQRAKRGREKVRSAGDVGREEDQEEIGELRLCTQHVFSSESGTQTRIEATCSGSVQQSDNTMMKRFHEDMDQDYSPSSR